MGRGGGGGEGKVSAPPPTHLCNNPLPVKYLITIQDGGIKILVYQVLCSKVASALQAMA